MDRRKYPHRILAYEAAGFLAILIIVFLDEIFGFPEQYMGGYVTHPEWGEFAVEAAAILAIAAAMLLMTRRLVSRLFYLERFLRVCAWCRKIHHEGGWVSLEDYFSSGFDTQTSHGMCPECFEKAKNGLP
jgi:hypothetical protein